MHQHAQFADLVDVLAMDFNIVDRLGDKTRPEALGERLEGKPNPKDSVSQQSLSPWASSASGTHSWRSTDHTGWMVVPVIVSTVPSAPSTSTLATTWTSRVTNRAVTTEPSPDAIGGQSSMEVTNASPETSSSGRLNGSMRPAQMPLRRIHERGRMISASTMPPSLRSMVMDTLAQVAWSGSDVSVYQRFKKPDRKPPSGSSNQ